MVLKPRFGLVRNRTEPEPEPKHHLVTLFILFGQGCPSFCVMAFVVSSEHKQIANVVADAGTLAS